MSKNNRFLTKTINCQIEIITKHNNKKNNNCKKKTSNSCLSFLIKKNHTSIFDGVQICKCVKTTPPKQPYGTH